MVINSKVVKISTTKILILILVATTFLRLFRLDYPNKYVFDEVYHAYTAREYLKGNKDAWSPWGKSPPGVAFEWLHPPISKEIMTTSMFILKSTDAWAWRLPGALLGILSVYLVYKLAFTFFKEERVALISAFLFSIDGLNFVQSRIGMNDIYLVAFILISTLFFARQKYFLSALFTGIAIATKWPGIFLLTIYLPILFYRYKFQDLRFKNLIYFILIPPIIYFASYTPYFLIGYTWSDFIELHKQIWWYQTNLKATHDYASPFWSWPLNLYPVWYHVEYFDNSIANIFSSGNPVVFWAGSFSILLTLVETIKKRSINLFIILLGFFVFWLPWAISPRIMFLYHFSPSVPFLALSLGYQLSLWVKDESRKRLVFVLLSLMLISFLILYPFLTGIPLLNRLVQLFFLTNLTKNPF